jgi:hypothetical protein
MYATECDSRQHELVDTGHRAPGRRHICIERADIRQPGRRAAGSSLPLGLESSFLCGLQLWPLSCLQSGSRQLLTVSPPPIAAPLRLCNCSGVGRAPNGCSVPVLAATPVIVLWPVHSQLSQAERCSMLWLRLHADSVLTKTTPGKVSPNGEAAPGAQASLLWASAAASSVKVGLRLRRIGALYFSGSVRT